MLFFLTIFFTHAYYIRNNTLLFFCYFFVVISFELFYYNNVPAGKKGNNKMKPDTIKLELVKELREQTHYSVCYLLAEQVVGEEGTEKHYYTLSLGEKDGVDYIVQITYKDEKVILHNIIPVDGCVRSYIVSKLEKVCKELTEKY